MSSALDLWDYRRRVFASYARVRESGATEETWMTWKRDRHELFSNHPQSPIKDRESFKGLPYFEYDLAWRTTGFFTPVAEDRLIVDHSGEGKTTFQKVGVVEFELKGQVSRLEVLWLDAYGGGIFLPFGDQTNGDITYRNGRYLLDTAKGADLGHESNRLILDFNYAYHPSCVHSSQWSCPLPPPANQLELAVTAGEAIIPLGQ